MAVLDPPKNTSLLLRSGNADCLIVLALRNVNAGDTLDLGATGSNLLQTVNRCVAISLTNSSVEIAVARAGTVVTMPAGFVNDIGYLMAWGAST